MIRVILIIGIGGFAGTIARFLFHYFIPGFYQVAFPAGTLRINFAWLPAHWSI
jgi:fluoride ion exporter CrcB/FEX